MQCEPEIEAPMPSASAANNHQQSLHRFWNINSAPKAATDYSALNLSAASSCDDCGAQLGGHDAMMDVEGAGMGRCTCMVCGKHVCFSCSVSNLGEQTRCLQCAGRKVGGESMGWADVSMQLG